MNLSVTFIDFLVVTVIIISAGYAAYRGFMSETLTIVAWAAAAFATLYFGPWVVPLAAELDRRRLPWTEWFLDSGTFDLFHDFNGIDPEAKTEFYQHDQNWSNRFILGDSLQVLAYRVYVHPRDERLGRFDYMPRAFDELAKASAHKLGIGAIP